MFGSKKFKSSGVIIKGISDKLLSLNPKRRVESMLVYVHPFLDG